MSLSLGGLLVAESTIGAAVSQENSLKSIESVRGSSWIPWPKALSATVPGRMVVSTNKMGPNGMEFVMGTLKTAVIGRSDRVAFSPGNKIATPSGEIK